MLKKTHVLVLGVATAGLLGFAAPMASAATVDGPLVNVSNNQVPVQACGNDVYGNVIGGQVPVEGDAIVASLLSGGSFTKASAVNNRGCAELNNQQNGGHGGHGLVNATNNQIPAQVCGNDVFINGIGGQVPLYGLAGAISALSPASITKSTAVNNQGCASASNQQNGLRHGKDGNCACQKAHADQAGAVTSGRAGDKAASAVKGITSGLGGSPVGGVISGLQVSK